MIGGKLRLLRLQFALLVMVDTSLFEPLDSSIFATLTCLLTSLHLSTGLTTYWYNSHLLFSFQSARDAFSSFVILFSKCMNSWYLLATPKNSSFHNIYDASINMINKFSSNFVIWLLQIYFKA